MVNCDRFDEFDRKFTAVLNKHTSKKKRWLRGDQKLSRITRYTHMDRGFF